MESGSPAIFTEPPSGRIRLVTHGTNNPVFALRQQVCGHVKTSVIKAGCREFSKLDGNKAKVFRKPIQGLIYDVLILFTGFTKFVEITLFMTYSVGFRSRNRMVGHIPDVGLSPLHPPSYGSLSAGGIEFYTKVWGTPYLSKPTPLSPCWGKRGR